MFNNSLAYSSELVEFGSIDLVRRFATYLNTLSATGPLPF